MKFPEQGSAAEKVCRWLMDFGPATPLQMKEALSVSTTTIRNCFDSEWLDRELISHREGYRYSVKPHLRDFYAIVFTKFKGEVAAPRHVQLMNRPAMQGYTAQLLAGKREGIRDISFVSVNSAPDGVWSYRQ